MKLETIKKDKRKNILIVVLIVLSAVSVVTLTMTRAKYKSVQTIKLASGVVNYKSADLKLVAINISEDGTNYTSITEIPEGNYTLNVEKSKCRIPTNELTGENAPIDTNIRISYENNELNILGMKKKNTKCYIYLDNKQGLTSDMIITAIESSSYFKSGTPTFGTTATGISDNNNGIFKVVDGMYNGYSYYWRGQAETNHVIFDSKCWRIVRINGDKSIRLIYNGTPSGSTCPGNGNSGAVIKGASDSEKFYATIDGAKDKSYYVGWTYGTGQRTLEGTPSNAKTQTDKWYNNNISVAAKTKVDTVGKFCNDRNVGSAPSSWSWASDFTTKWSATGTAFAYAASKRMFEDKAPILSCAVGDTYTLSVGAITADEVMLAGGNNENNKSYYLYASATYWTMSPSYWKQGANVFIIGAYGNLSYYSVDWEAPGLRPVINLRSDVTFNLGSDGTQNNPYIVQ